MLEFPKTFEAFISTYKFNDNKEVYTNGSSLIPVFRVLQGWHHFSQNLQNKYSKEITARNRVIVELYTLMLRNLSDFNDPSITSEVLVKLNDIYEDIESFHLHEEVDNRLLKS